MLTGVIIFLLLLIALLAMPVTLTFKLFYQQHVQGDIEVWWLFDLVHVRFSPGQLNAPSPGGEETVRQFGRVERPSRHHRNLFAVFRQKAFRRRIFRFMRDCWRALHKREVRLCARIGLGDPADTGQLWAIVGPVAGILSNAKEVSIDIIPEFIDTTIELDSSGSIRIFPLQIMYLAVGLLLSPPIWKGIKEMRKVEE
jgi:hypothetical protein